MSSPPPLDFWRILCTYVNELKKPIIADAELIKLLLPAGVPNVTYQTIIVHAHLRHLKICGDTYTKYTILIEMNIPQFH